jgi:hypothetical protein
LKTEAFKATTAEKWAFRSPDGKTFRNKLPNQQLMDQGWTRGKVKFQRVESCMSPRHERWQEYRNAKRRATLLLAARLILKANNGIVPAKEEIGPFVSMGIFRSHARTSSGQKGLAFAAYRQLRKLENRLRKQPQRFAEVGSWMRQRESEASQRSRT